MNLGCCRGPRLGQRPPLRIEGLCALIKSLAVKSGAALGVFLVPILRGSMGLSAVIVLMAIVSVLGGLITAIFAEEIEDQGSLEERHRPSQNDAR